jgi:glycosyltransferase involved in cell wall biosynthesis
MEETAYRAAARIIATTPGARRHLVDRGFDGERIDVVELGADPHLFRPGCGDGSFRAAHGLEDRFVAMFPGAHGPANGLDRVLDAAKILQDRDSRVTLVLLGKGQLKPALQEQARRQHLRNVVFLDPVPKTELARAMDEVDVGLAVLKPCGILDKILSNKLFDFMAAGKPVVANLPGDMAAILDGEGCGRVVLPYTPQRLADVLDELAASPREELDAMGLRARKLAETRYSRVNLATVFEASLLAALRGS